MRFIVFGVGAIGGTIAASLALAGHEVVGIARGAQLEAINRNGLHFRTPLVDEQVRFACYNAPSEIGFTADDVVLLTMKSQDTHEALAALRAAGAFSQAIVCAQNGVDNERMALRLFPNVYGATVMIPGTYIKPGEVACHSKPKRGMIDIGRYPAGLDATAKQIAAALERSEFAAFPLEQVMRSKYGKLLENQRNMISAALGNNEEVPGFEAVVQAEGEAVYRAAGIDWMEIGANDDRRHGLVGHGEIPGVDRVGDSSTQSLRRGTGSIETDYLNGEIALLGRLHRVPTPLNTALTRLGQRMVAQGLEPGSIAPDDLRRLMSES